MMFQQIVLVKITRTLLYHNEDQKKWQSTDYFYDTFCSKFHGSTKIEKGKSRFLLSAYTPISEAKLLTSKTFQPIKTTRIESILAIEYHFFRNFNSLEHNLECIQETSFFVTLTKQCISTTYIQNSHKFQIIVLVRSIR